MNCDIYENFSGLADEIRAQHLTPPISLGRAFATHWNVTILIVGVRKWAWDDMGDHPQWPLTIGMRFHSHHIISAKYDVFIYERIQ